MLSKFYKKKVLFALTLSIIVALILIAFLNLGLFTRWQNSLSDILYEEKKPIDDIVIIKIDDKSLQEIGRWPWDRKIFANFFSKFDNTSVIGIDIGFFEPQDKKSDEMLANSIENLNVVFALEFVYDDGKKTILKPINELSSKNSEVGFINIFTERDGITRKTPLRIMYNNTSYDSFAARIYKLYLKRDFVYKKNNLLINFIGGSGSFSSISFSDVFYNRTEIPKNKIILIGATSPDLHDSYYVPTSKSKEMPGVEIHANILQTMLTKDFIENESKISLIFTIVILAILTSFILARLKILISSILLVLIAFFYIVLAIFVFKKGIILDIVYPLLTILITYVVVTSVFYVVEEKSKKWVINIFGRYVSKDVARDILDKANRDKVELRGFERNITVLFADIRGFTSLSEKMKPKEVVSMLNLYLGEMTNSVFKYKGTLDKYIGDCIMAIFNAPLEQKNHALCAIKTAIDMQTRIKKLHRKSNTPKVQCGIGINTGEAVIGNIGSKERHDYTAIGDTVNLASRLCSVAGPGQIIISQSTYFLVKDSIKAKKLEPIKVKGKEKPVQIYLVLGLRDQKTI